VEAREQVIDLDQPRAATRVWTAARWALADPSG
jgi:hypothetical protein